MNDQRVVGGANKQRMQGREGTSGLRKRKSIAITTDKSNPDAGGEGSWAIYSPSVPSRRVISKREEIGKKRRIRPGAPLYALDKVRSVEFNLTLDINNLRQEIQRLAALKKLLQSKALLTREARVNSQLRIVHEYARVFRYGLQPDVQNKALVSPGMLTQATQETFLKSIMDEQVDCGDGIVGIDALLAQFHSYSRCFHPLVVELDDFQVLSIEEECIVQARGMFRAKITKQALVELFPHVLRVAGFARRLEGKMVECNCSVVFTFGQQGKVVSYNRQIDLLAAFMKILENASDVAFLLKHARIGKNTANTLTDFGSFPMPVSAPALVGPITAGLSDPSNARATPRQRSFVQPAAIMPNTLLPSVEMLLGGSFENLGEPRADGG